MDEDPFDGASDDWSHLSADDFGTFSEMMSSPSPVEEPPQPRAKSGNQKPSSNKVPEDTELPPNVADLNQWGRTLIQFGKYKTAGMTHEELALADTKEMNSCKVWVVAHLRSDDRTVPRLGTLPSRLHRCRHDQEACGDPLRELRAPIRPSQEFVIQLPPWWTFDSQKAVNSSAHAHHSSPPFVMLMFFFLRYQCDSFQSTNYLKKDFIGVFVHRCMSRSESLPTAGTFMAQDGKECFRRSIDRAANNPKHP